MNSENIFPYRLYGYEPGIFVELYLPKKSEFQGNLYDTLTNGFKLENVRKHFLSEKKQEIKELLENYTELKEYDDKYIESLEPMFWGYSMYEVDGVFCSNQEEGKVIEERTQIIRIMFLPDFPNIVKKVGISDPECSKIKSIFNSYLKHIWEERKLIANERRGDEKKIIDELDKWIRDISLFLVGYLVFEICSKIKELTFTNDLNPEKEIWLSSFWNLHVNRIKLS
jgi:hypothetical protein